MAHSRLRGSPASWKFREASCVRILVFSIAEALQSSGIRQLPWCRQRQPAIGSAVTQESDNPLENELLRNSSLDIQIRIPNNLWIRHRNGNAELSGNLRITKASGGKPALTGLIETIRGWVGFQGKRFILTRGEVEFNGSETINPALDIVAEYRVSNYLVNIVVKGTAEKPTLTLTSDPQLDQADILSVLLFNKPISSLEKSEQISSAAKCH